MATKPARFVLLTMVVLSCIGCDRVTKQVASARLRNLAPMSFLGDTLRIQYAENPGAFLGWGGTLPDPVRFALLIVVNAALLAGVTGVLLARWNMDRAAFTALALILGGGLGNLIDRVFQNGLVIDFINLGLGPVRTGIFNVADMAITLGSLLVMALSFRNKSDAISQG